MNNKCGVALFSFSALCAAAPADAQVQASRDRLGDVLRIALPLGAAALAATEQDWRGLGELGLSLVAAQGTTGVLKHVVGSRRPDGTGLGFPSGHTSIAFASAAFVHERYGITYAAPFYGLATLTAYSRVHTRHHFTKDVVGGAVVGVASAFLFTHPIAPQSTLSVGWSLGGLQLGVASRW